MKVLFINTVCGTGSTGRIVVDLYRMLEKKGHICMVGYGRGTCPKDVNGVRIGTDWDMYMHGIKTRLMDREGFGSRNATKRFIEKVKEFEPDIIHLHNIHGYYIHIPTLFEYMYKEKVKVIWTLHDCWTFTGHCSHYDYIGCQKWKTGCYKCQQKREYPRSIFLDSSKKNYKEKKYWFNLIEDMTVITPSKWLENQVRSSFFCTEKILTIWNGIDINKFIIYDGVKIREKYNLNDKKILLGVANVWTEKKGLEEFIHLSNILPNEIQLILIGVSKRIKKKLPKNIIAIEHTNSIEELAEFYSVADVFVNLTLEDTFPTTNLEALSCGTPVITFDTGGSPESITEKCGRVIQKNEINRIPELVYQLGNRREECRKRAIVFKKEERYKEYMKVYKIEGKRNE